MIIDCWISFSCCLFKLKELLLTTNFNKINRAKFNESDRTELRQQKWKTESQAEQKYRINGIKQDFSTYSVGARSQATCFALL